jgi:hypothetical protein
MNEVVSLAEIHSGLKIGDKVIHKVATYTNRTDGQIVVGFTGRQDVLIQMPSGYIQKCNWKYVNKVGA